MIHSIFGGAIFLILSDKQYSRDVNTPYNKHYAVFSVSRYSFIKNNAVFSEVDITYINHHAVSSGGRYFLILNTAQFNTQFLGDSCLFQREHMRGCSNSSPGPQGVYYTLET